MRSTHDSAYHLIEDSKKYLSNKKFLAEEYHKIANGIKSRLEQTVQPEFEPANMNYEEIIHLELQIDIQLLEKGVAEILNSLNFQMGREF